MGGLGGGPLGNRAGNMEGGAWLTSQHRNTTSEQMGGLGGGRQAETQPLNTVGGQRGRLRRNSEKAQR